MTDSIAILPPGWRATDNAGAVVPGAVLRVYVAGSTTPKAVYANQALTVSHGAIVTCDASGYPTSDGAARVVLYTGTAAYKLVLQTDAGVTIWSHDGLRGATPAPVGLDTAIPENPITVITSDTTVPETEQGRVYQARCSSGVITVTLPSSVEVGSKWSCTIVHEGSANTVTIVTVAGQTISYRGALRSAVTLLTRGEAVEVISYGSHWIARLTGTGELADAVGILRITDRRSAPPSGPAAGARYIATGTPSGAWASYSAGWVIEADGAGGWLPFIPDEGWVAWITDENVMTVWSGSAWVDQTGMRRPTALTIPTLVAHHQTASGVGGGNPTTGDFYTSTLNVLDSNTITGAALGSNRITLPTGTYKVRFSRTFFNTLKSQIKFRSLTTTTALYGIQAMVSEDNSAGSGTYHQTSVVLTGEGIIEVTAASEQFDLQYDVEQTFTNGLGLPCGRGVPETYATVVVESRDIRVTWP